jgi:hypothetical protein
MQQNKFRIGLTGLAVLVLILTCEEARSQEADECSAGFKQGAENFVQVQYRTKNRRGVGKQVVTEAEVLWQANEMLEDVNCYDLTQTTLLYKPVNIFFYFEI